jgi:hypothetical protein
MPLDEAGVAKLVYAPDSKSGEVTLMSVRVRPPAPHDCHQQPQRYPLLILSKSILSVKG